MYLSPTDIADAAKLYAKDQKFYTFQRLAGIYHVSEKTISEALSNLPVAFTKPPEEETGWTEGRIDLLKRLWKEGKSANEMRVILKVTRNACISRLHRLGLTGGGRTHRTHPSRASMVAILLETRRKSPGLKKRAKLDGMPPSLGIRIVDLERRHCRWPYDGAPGEEITYCGHEVVDKKSYCPAHQSICYVPVDEAFFDNLIE